MKQKTALITGGAGFIGSQLTRKLVNIFEKVIVIDNMVNGKIENLGELNSNPNVIIVKEDIRSSDAISGLIQKSDVIYHLACLGVRHSIHSPQENYDVNANGTLNLLNLSNGNVDKFVYISTSEVYGTAINVPMTEYHPTFPLTVYGAGKLAGEALTRSFFETYDMPTVIVRPFNSYGPASHHEGDSGEVIPKFMLRGLTGKPLLIFGDGSQTRDFTFVEDTAEGILKAGIYETAVGQTINIGSGQEICIKDLALHIIRLTESDSEIRFVDSRPGDVLRLFSDSTIAKNLLTYSAEIPLVEGLEKLLAWYKTTYSDIELINLTKTDIDKNWVASSSSNPQIK